MSLTRGVQSLRLSFGRHVEGCAVYAAVVWRVLTGDFPARSTSEASSAISAALRSLNGGRVGPESRPITFIPALIIETA